MRRKPERRVRVALAVGLLSALLDVRGSQGRGHFVNSLFVFEGDLMSHQTQKYSLFPEKHCSSHFAFTSITFTSTPPFDTTRAHVALRLRHDRRRRRRRQQGGGGRVQTTDTSTRHPLTRKVPVLICLAKPPPPAAAPRPKRLHATATLVQRRSHLYIHESKRINTHATVHTSSLPAAARVCGVRRCRG